MRINSLLTTALAATASGVNAWGFIGHKTTALLASRYLLPETSVFVRSFLYRDQTIMDAAVWADRFAHIPFGRFSGAWHYIDAKDNPPDKCKVTYTRDCDDKKGCIVSALVNMTARIQDEDLRWADRAQALRFILHFLGDIHQPLHTESKLRGGNGIKVLFNGRDANLHSVWDSMIIERFKGRPSDRVVAAFATELEGRIEEGGVYAADKESWTSCLNITDVETCGVGWAQSANDYVCSYVLKKDVEGKELGGEYADGALPIIERSIATAGYRLAGWLNTIVTGKSGLEAEDLEERSRRLSMTRSGEYDMEALWGSVTGLREVDEEELRERATIAEYERETEVQKLKGGIMAQH